MAGSVTGMNIRSPSFRGGMNSLPIRGTSDTAPAKTRTAAAERHDAVPERPAEQRPVEPDERPHHRVVALATHPAADQERAEDRHQGHGEERRPGHREGLGEGERVEELALLAGEREDRDEGQDDDGHREEDRPSDQARRIQHGGGDELAVAGIDPPQSR